MKNIQVQKAENLLALHHAGHLLVLPNIWDVIGAKLLEHAGYPAVATASAAVAYSRGYYDGEKISFRKLLKILKEICDGTSLPVTADIERGYAETTVQLRNNIKALIECGVVGINIEDSDENKKLLSTDRQCDKIRVIRKVSDDLGIRLVINARTDIFLQEDFAGNKIAAAAERARQYMEAGADCFYPILCNNDELSEIKSLLDIPINVIATKDTYPMHKLEEMGIARLSLGPGLLRVALSRMQAVIRHLKDYEDYGSFTGEDVMTSADIREIIQ